MEGVGDLEGRVRSEGVKGAEVEKRSGEKRV